MQHPDWKKFKSIGTNVRIAPSAHFSYPEETVIGDNVAIDAFTYFSVPMEIGNYVHIGPHTSITGGKKSRFIASDFCGLAAGVRIACSSDDASTPGLTNPMVPEAFRCRVIYSTIIMEKHAGIFSSAVILPGVVLREGAVVGALSLVNRSLEPWSIYAGVPAKLIKPRPKEEILQQEAKLLQVR